MKNVEKYERGYFMPPYDCTDWVKKDYIDAPPVWCSVDLRDGNQALITPMSLEQKLEFFAYLVKLGFKEIEVGFPAASETEFEFVRTLIEKNMIPDDVAIQVLTQSREHIIKKTFDALKGAKNAIVHLYNSTSVAQREQVFKKDKEDIIKIAVSGAELVKKYAAQYEGNFRFEYSPESFTGTEMEFALRISNAVLDIWKPESDSKAIINLPSTVQESMSHVYASQVEYMSKNLKYRENVVLSVHPHNDRGCGVCDAEMGILAGAQRVEGTLFGNGERTGNTDIVTVAMNMYTQGVDPGLDFGNMNDIIEIYERMTDMVVPPRQPYSGKLVFTAFSGSHQDAIAKGMKCRREANGGVWNVPYLVLDPKDIGRSYDGDVIRINSQSGKGGIGYLLEQKYGFIIPKQMREEVGYMVKGVSDHEHKELKPEEVYKIFCDNYINLESPINVTECHFKQENGITATCTVKDDSGIKTYTACGNGRLDAVCNVLQKHTGYAFTDLTYTEHALERGSDSKAACYVGVTTEDNRVSWGVGVDSDIITASVKALISAVNKTQPNR